MSGPRSIQPRRAANLRQYPLDRMLADPARVSAAATLIANAKRPIVIAGGGVHSSQATAELGELQALGLPVATTVMGKGSVQQNGRCLGESKIAKTVRQSAVDAAEPQQPFPRDDGLCGWLPHRRSSHSRDAQESGRGDEARCRGNSTPT
jgi:thiamine pyrophosphate-dependent enzyme